MDSKEFASDGAEPKGATEASIPSKGNLYSADSWRAISCTGVISFSKVSISKRRARGSSPWASGSACATSADAAGKNGIPGGTLHDAQNWKLPSPPAVSLETRKIAPAIADAKFISSGSASMAENEMRGPMEMTSGTSAIPCKEVAGPAENSPTSSLRSSSSIARKVCSAPGASVTSIHSSKGLVLIRVVWTSNPASENRFDAAEHTFEAPSIAFDHIPNGWSGSSVMPTVIVRTLSSGVAAAMLESWRTTSRIAERLVVTARRTRRPSRRGGPTELLSLSEVCVLSFPLSDRPFFHTILSYLGNVFLAVYKKY
eukprot:scaffold48392_cov31-Tisochrysis_lutea.AAC.6